MSVLWNSLRAVASGIPPRRGIESRELRRSARRRIGFGALAIATIPFVGVLAASYHVVVGIVVTTIYGAAALAVGTAYIATGVADRLRARTPPLQLPEARVIKAP